ncbi:hypothetical protein [Thiohalobacter thiocyanaticus]|uniref:Uncharacterized protein n=1 Tax=Thiohalobacter thiocyanaticus TaxID=585455 RepID=A0A426QK58_9GAMM|nr:hypothetical protein [Thiohalobacter thiocyanaticus]RRQ22131.1 hypothetical protein D6C00_09325 [Thiohalobacter thiocyanaticus]
MSQSRKIVLVQTPHRPATAGSEIDLAGLRDALRERGAEVEVAVLDADQVDGLLDRLEAGALPVVFRGERCT